MWMGGGGADPKGPAGAFKAQLWASRPAPSPHGDAVDICVFTKIWYFFVFWFSYNSVQLFDEQFLPNCELVDSRHRAPPRECLPHQCTGGKKFSDSWEKSINNSFWPRELKTIDIFYIFIIIKIKYFLVFSFSNSVHKKYSYFWEKSTGNTVAYGPMTSKPLTFLNLNIDNQDIVFFGFHFLNSVCTVSR